MSEKNDERPFLTMQMLRDMESGTIFAKGVFIDSPEGCNVAGTGKAVKWVAVRGGIADWAIYCQNPHYIDSDDPVVAAVGYAGEWGWDQIAQVGDKIHNEENIERLIHCAEGVLEAYNH